jgi:hypothetical protein
MKQRKNLLDFFLWWSVIGSSIWVGGTLYMMLVIDPQWSTNPPDSVRFFFRQTEFTKYIWNFFGPPFIIFRSFLPQLMALLLGWYSRPHRKYLLITLICTLFVIIFTLTYVYPINDTLIFKAGGAMPAEEIKSMVNHWILADRLRFAVCLVGYFFLLKAFRIPSEKSGKEI